MQAINMSKAYTHGRDIQITSNIATDIDIFVDENKFLACIVNIIKNAAEAIEEEGLIEVTAKLDNKLAHIVITNNGKPISQEAQQNIFKEGYSTKATGSGLGLHICKENLKAQSADLLLVKSDNNETVFKIIIPVVEL